MTPPAASARDEIRFWAAVVLTAAATGVGAIALSRVLTAVQRVAWGSGAGLLDAASECGALRHVAVLLAAGAVVGISQLLLQRLSSGNAIDTTTAIWFHAGRLPALRTLASAVVSVVIVGMGVSLGREGAPKQAGAVFANFFSDKLRLSDDRRRLLVACGAGAGMSAAYGVPLGGSLFSLEVIRGILALRFVLPALLASVIATAVSWIGLADAPTYIIPVYASSAWAIVWAVLTGFIAGLVSVAYVRAITWAELHKPTGWRRAIVPVVVLGLLGAISIPFPHLLGNGSDVSQLAFAGQVGPGLACALFLLKPIATVFCVQSGAPGGLFTPSLTVGALLGALLGKLLPGIAPGFCALLGASAMLSATTQGPLSTVVIIMEMTGRDRSFIVPVLFAVATATYVARRIELRSVYDARLTDEQTRVRRLSS